MHWSWFQMHTYLIPGEGTHIFNWCRNANIISISQMEHFAFESSFDVTKQARDGDRETKDEGEIKLQSKQVVLPAQTMDVRELAVTNF